MTVAAIRNPLMSRRRAARECERREINDPSGFALWSRAPVPSKPGPLETDAPRPSAAARVRRPAYRAPPPRDPNQLVQALRK